MLTIGLSLLPHSSGPETEMEKCYENIPVLNCLIHVRLNAFVNHCQHTPGTRNNFDSLVAFTPPP